MRKYFYLGAMLLIAFEIANVYFIMPLPGSQRVRSIDFAYALYSSRWIVRFAALALVVAGFRSIWRQGVLGRLAAVSLLLLAAGVAYVTNGKMAADQIFIAPASLRMSPAGANVVERNRLVVGTEVGGSARAYPIQFIGYHHQVRDTVLGKPIMVTFCTVCRTGRVFSPVVDGSTEDFRLVGMDHFNAMLEDRSTGSWWRQATGEAVAGPRKGKALAELASVQMTLGQWLGLHPQSLIMQPDPALAQKYSRSFDYESGASRSALTGTDTASWHEKSWVVGITHNGVSKAYDWNRLRRERAINDSLGGAPIVLAMSPDDASFAAFERGPSQLFVMHGDSLASGPDVYDLSGRGRAGALRAIQASQEFWHSWRTFQPGTRKY